MPESGDNAAPLHAAEMAAEMIVFRDQDGWRVHFDGCNHGPHPFRSSAVRAAVETAQLAGRLGRTVRVREISCQSRSRVLWPRPKGLLRRVVAR